MVNSKIEKAQEKIKKLKKQVRTKVGEMFQLELYHQRYEQLDTQVSSFEDTIESLKLKIKEWKKQAQNKKKR